MLSMRLFFFDDYLFIELTRMFVLKLTFTKIVLHTIMVRSYGSIIKFRDI